jgi:hypothetical protein
VSEEARDEGLGKKTNGEGHGLSSIYLKEELDGEGMTTAAATAVPRSATTIETTSVQRTFGGTQRLTARMT